MILEPQSESEPVREAPPGARRPAVVWHPEYEIDIGPHVFPAQKFRLLKEALVAGGIVREEEVELAPEPSDEELLAVLEPEYLADLRRGLHTRRTYPSELPISSQIVRGCARAAGGTLLAARRALERGGACHLGGGFHHGFADHAEGFCYINDVAMAAANMRRLGLARRIAIVDVDVHQGNGTARIFRDEPEVFTFSIHQERLYPSPKERSDWDIGLDVGARGAEYLPLLRDATERILAEHRPELVFYLAGADAADGDQLGRLRLTPDDMAERDRIVLGTCAREGVPFVTVVAGGYQRDVSKTIAVHVNTVMTAISALDGKKS